MAGKILIVENDEDSRTGMAAFFDAYGFEVRSSDGADEAIGIALGRQFAPDILISDWMLDGNCDGVDLARALLHTSCPKVAIIFVSGRSMDQLRSKALGLPVHRFMPKPVSLFDLKTAVDRIFERRPADGPCKIGPLHDCYCVAYVLPRLEPMHASGNGKCLCSSNGGNAALCEFCSGNRPISPHSTSGNLTCNLEQLAPQGTIWEFFGVDVDIEVLGSSTNRFEQCRFEIGDATARCAEISRVRFGKRDYYRTVLPRERLMDMGSDRRINAGDKARKTERPRVRINDHRGGSATVCVPDVRIALVAYFVTPKENGKERDKTNAPLIPAGDRPSHNKIISWRATSS